MINGCRCNGNRSVSERQTWLAQSRFLGTDKAEPLLDIKGLLSDSFSIVTVGYLWLKDLSLSEITFDSIMLKEQKIKAILCNI